MGVALAVLSLVSSLYSANEQRKEKKKQAQLMDQRAKEERKLAALDKKRKEVANVRAMKQRIREYNLARGELENQGANFNAFQSSGVAGGIASLRTNVASQLGKFSGDIDAADKGLTINNNISDLNVATARSQAREATYATYQAASDSIFSGTGGFNEGASIWDTGKMLSYAGPIKSTSSQSEATITKTG